MEPEISVEIAADPRHVKNVRDQLARSAGDLRLSPAERRDVTLIVSELVSNAIDASPTPSTVTVSVARCDPPDQEAVCITVVNASATPWTAVPDPDTVSLPSPDALRGRGLAIVRNLSREVTITTDATSTTVVAIYERKPS